MSKEFASGKANVLVTGGAGFLGTHVCQELVKKYNVICLDNFLTGAESNIEVMLQNPNFEFIKHDLIHPLDLASFPELKKFEVAVQGVQQIYHFACPTSPKEFNKYPIETLLANSYGTNNALALAVKYKAKFLFASTAAIYGTTAESKEAIPENEWGIVDPLGPRNAYIEGKRFAESLVDNYGTVYGIDVKVARIFRTYGPKMRIDDGRMTPDWIRAAMEGNPVIIHGNADERTSYCYVTDMVEGLIQLMETNVEGAVNLGSSDVYTMREIAEAIIRLTSSTSQIQADEAYAEQTTEPIPDITKARNSLGWIPMMDLDGGLNETIKHMQVHSHLYGVDLAKSGRASGITQNQEEKG